MNAGLGGNGRARDVEDTPAIGRAIAVAVAVSMLSLVAGCRDSYKWHQKLTLTVETPSGELSGTSVTAVTARYGQLPLSGNDLEHTVVGEAAVVEVASGRYLFALLTSPHNLAERVWRDSLPVSRGEALSRIERLKGARSIRPGDYPVLATFDDIDKRDSVHVVPANNLATTFGAGFHLKSMTLEITGEKATSGKMEALLSWLGNSPEEAVLSKVDLHDFSPEGALRQGDFVRR